MFTYTGNSIKFAREKVSRIYELFQILESSNLGKYVLLCSFLGAVEWIHKAPTAICIQPMILANS